MHNSISLHNHRVPFATRGRTFFMAGLLLLSLLTNLKAQVQCDPQKVMTAASCIKCHADAGTVWKNTPHYKTFETMRLLPESKQIADRMGVRSIKRSDLCVQCHFTQTETSPGRTKAISGVSCESCHGAAKEWIDVHSDYGGIGVTKQTESPAHAQQRLMKSVELGMRNPHNLYLMAKSCFACHSVPNEKLINVGGHSAGSAEFEFVSWSQGSVRHNFLRTGGSTNAKASPENLRVMWLAGKIADLEFHTRATARATEKQKYGLQVAQRAASTAKQLYDVQQQINHPELQKVLQAFSKAKLKVNNAQQLNEIADSISQAGFQFAATADGSKLTSIDSLLPNPQQYR